MSVVPAPSGRPGTGQPRTGRHRRPGRAHLAPWAVATAVVVPVALVATVIAAVGTGGREGATTTPGQPPPGTTQTPTGVSPEIPVDLAGDRLVEVSGRALTVTTTLRVPSQASVRAVPATTTLVPGLELREVRAVDPDGTTQRLDAPLELSPEQPMVFQGVYRLRSCPDLIPTRWPMPVTFDPANTAVVWIRTDAPQRTAPVMCPGAKSRATPLGPLTGRVVAGVRRGTATVALRWRGPGRLTVVSVGAPSGRPVLVAGGGCGPACVVRIPRGSSSRIRLSPVESCPARSAASRLLPLEVRVGDGPVRLVTARVRALDRWFPRACS